MVEVLKKDYWSKSNTFLLPLTGLTKSQKYPIKSYLFWDGHTIEDYKLMLRITYLSDYEEFIKYARKVIFPILDKNQYLLESYDYEGETVLVLDLSEWGEDIETFLQGKYSKLSRIAKDAITDYHTFYSMGRAEILISISAVLNPMEKFPILDDKRALDYVAEHYGFNLVDLREIGEIADVYDKKQETLSDLAERVIEGGV